MNMTIYEEATWYDIERNKMHLKKDGESYVADSMLLKESISLRQENDSLKKENDRLRREIDRMVMNSSPTAAELRRVRGEWKKDRDDNAKLREMCSGLYQKYCDLRDNFFFVIDPEMDALVKSLRELGIEV